MLQTNCYQDILLGFSIVTKTFCYNLRLLLRHVVTKENESELQAQFRACLSLAFVPSEHVQAAFLDLWSVTDERLYDILHLLEDYYIMGRRRGKGRTTPRYPIQFVYEQTVQGTPRTNNTAEAWNRWWKVVDGKAHPNIFAMLEK